MAQDLATAGESHGMEVPNPGLSSYSGKRPRVTLIRIVTPVSNSCQEKEMSFMTKFLQILGA